MTSVWKSKVMPKLKKFFDKGKKKGASEVCKNFDKSKESLDKEIEEKGADLNPKVVEIYRSSSTFIAKKLLKEPNEANVKGNPNAVQGVLQELVKAGFPGAQVVCDAGAKFGPALLPGPVVYLFEKASVYLVDEPLAEEPKEEETRELKVEDIKAESMPAAEPETTETVPETKAAATAPAAVEEEKKEEAAKEVEEPTATTPPPVAITEAAAAVETSAPVVIEELATSGVAIPATATDDAPVTPAPAASEPAPAPAPPPPAADKTA